MVEGMEIGGGARKMDRLLQGFHCCCSKILKSVDYRLLRIPTQELKDEYKQIYRKIEFIALIFQSP